MIVGHAFIQVTWQMSHVTRPLSHINAGATITINPQRLQSALSHIENAAAAIAESHRVPPSHEAHLSHNLETRASAATAVDVDWAALSDVVSRDLGLRVDLHSVNVPFVVEGVRRGLEGGGLIRHGKGACVWRDGVKYEGIDCWAIVRLTVI